MARKISSAWPVALALVVVAGLLIWAWWLISQSGEDSRTTPEFRKMEVTEITIATTAGREVKLTVRLADEQDEQLAGFQHIGRRVIAESLILFVFPQEIFGKFHMRNVVAPLDIAFIKGDGEIFAILRMEPGPELYGPIEPFKYALEAPAGLFARKGITPGSRLVLVSSP
ncbi:MAG: DUF192 domain-containing protein [Candidatus Bipolaricaulia bacterium]